MMSISYSWVTKEKTIGKKKSSQQIPGPVILPSMISSQALCHLHKSQSQCFSLLDNVPAGFQDYAMEIGQKYQEKKKEKNWPHYSL